MEDEGLLVRRRSVQGRYVAAWVTLSIGIAMLVYFMVHGGSQ
jgi:hypothetical protein